ARWVAVDVADDEGVVAELVEAEHRTRLPAIDRVIDGRIDAVRDHRGAALESSEPRLVEAEVGVKDGQAQLVQSLGPRRMHILGINRRVAGERKIPPQLREMRHDPDVVEHERQIRLDVLRYRLDAPDAPDLALAPRRVDGVGMPVSVVGVAEEIYPEDGDVPAVGEAPQDVIADAR